MLIKPENQRDTNSKHLYYLGQWFESILPVRGRSSVVERDNNSCLVIEFLK